MSFFAAPILPSVVAESRSLFAISPSFPVSPQEVFYASYSKGLSASIIDNGGDCFLSPLALSKFL